MPLRLYRLILQNHNSGPGTEEPDTELICILHWIQWLCYQYIDAAHVFAAGRIYEKMLGKLFIHQFGARGSFCNSPDRQ